MKIFLNGDIVDAAEARIDPMDRGLTLGDGLFETIHVLKGVARRLPAHFARLRHGADVLKIPFAPSDDDLTHDIIATIKANGIDEGVLRLTLTRGPAPRGLALPEQPAPSLMITGAALEAHEPKPVCAIIAATTCRNEHSPLAGIKSLNYLDNVLARREAVEAGADEALLLNTTGAVAEATAANVFVCIEGQILTPPISDGALPGVMRADVMQATGAVEQTIAPHAFGQVSEAFLTNSLGINPLIKVNDQNIGDGSPGPVSQKLQALV